jgi:hypothetical protein
MLSMGLVRSSPVEEQLKQVIVTWKGKLGMCDAADAKCIFITSTRVHTLCWRRIAVVPTYSTPSALPLSLAHNSRSTRFRAQHSFRLTHTSIRFRHFA